MKILSALLALCSIAAPSWGAPATESAAAKIAANIGAKVPYIRYEAEAGEFAGAPNLVGPNRNIGDLGGEASGRRAVKLVKVGDGVEWTASEAANSIVVRNCIPDSEDGNGMEATLSLYINDIKKDTLKLTSKYAWLYGPEGEPKNTPALGTPRHIYDEADALFGFVIKKGDRVMLKKDAGDKAAYYGIDFIELEMVAPPLPCPAGFVNLADEGVTPENFSAKIAGLIQNFEWKEGYKGKKGLYIPPGRYKMATQALINNNIAPGFEIKGAGMWHTVIYNDSDAEMGQGTPGFNINGKKVKFSDFAVFGGGRTRDGSGKPFFPAYGDGSVMERIWVEHMTCGFWVRGGQGVTNNLTIDSCRLRNLGADGINLCNGTKNSTVVNTTVRSSGDDGIAIWSAPEHDGAAGGIDYPGCANNTIKNCTVELPWRANAFAIYGGKDNTITNCIARDTLTYAGVNISSMFKPRPFAGTTRIENMLIERCGGPFWRNQQFGALWVLAHDSPVQGVVFKDISVFDSTFSGIQLKSETYNQAPQSMNVDFENVTVLNPGTFGLWVQEAIGTANFKNSHLVAAPDKAVTRSKDKAGSIQVTADKASSGFGAAGK
ncbi:hypothetical protein EON83_25090 [bacterium]|nr:MAG: hypothetical protein EON83_25090 [bacterium]